ncbi:hypothetical protein LCG56_26975 [Pseudomonas cannabina pv. alisalensis]|uniref:Uncharacterized protein n=1 Tax=Pseudomonas syringae pv. maculicola str. ES4326 TaxID=629265 RepID=A0A8T8C002_PSEYM|nr:MULTISPECIES: hypothetical protein [Pseudomonas syringae group]QHE96871.1 hypothetical protein PMA4326_009695 [Pseudomonas syringae pv. maculicola str. ES4326]UBY97530.1 hypothetical protein LCG56_26975 [Pseudomonas cannabina pv. alisalensis]
MAAGDLNGDLKDAYLTPEQRAAKLAGRSSTGPVGRATQQLAVQPVIAQPVSLADAAPKQTSFDATNTPQQYLPQAAPTAIPAQPSAPNLAIAVPRLNVEGRAPATQNAAPTLASAFQSGQAAQQASGDFRTIAPPASSAPAPIAVRVGQSGVPEFSNQAPDLRSAMSLPPVSQPRAQLTSLADALPTTGLGYGSGSIGNLGDGIGSFSQTNAGDGRLAMDRFARAANIRDAGRNKDRLDLANAKLTRDQNFTVVADSSRRPTLADLRFDQQRQMDTAGMQEAVKGAQAQIDNRRQGEAGDLQLKQASRLDGIMQDATSPNATPEARAAYLAATDPTGEKAAARQLTQANIEKLGADARASDAKAKNLAGGLDGQLKQLEIEKRRTDATTAAQAATSQKVGALDIAKDAQKLVSEISGADNLDSITGTISSRTPTVRDGSQDLINKANRLQTLLTADNLKLMTGVLTDRDITFLSQIGAGLGIGENGINGSIDATKQRLGEIGSRLGEKVAAYEKNMPSGQQSLSAPSASTAAPAPAKAPAQPQPQVVRVNSPADVAKLPSGALFIAPDGTTRRKP